MAPGKRPIVSLKNHAPAQTTAFNGEDPTHHVWGNTVLYQWGTLQFEVHPLNVHEVDHSTATDWAQKPIAGGAIYREWVGENDEEIFFRGRVFPYRIGGMTELDVFEGARRSGVASALLRGDGVALGWFVCERFVRQHHMLTFEGVGQLINFEAVMARVPVPPAEEEFPVMWLHFLGGG